MDTKERPSVMVAKAIWEARGKVEMAVFPLMYYEYKFSFWSDFFFFSFQKGTYKLVNNISKE